ncbi:MAG: cysteine--tRNA ligase [Roseovarius sp.]|nr:cysteine--tRNA ligase [Roseovarius sp.]
MTTIKLHNTRTRKRDVFTPLDPANVRMYVCGPTVYDRAHLGNARPVVVFDVLYRLLRHVYGPDHVTYVRNFTDVDDKINARAAESGRPISEITAETTQWFLDDMGALGALTPDYMPRATEYIPQMVAMIEELVARGHAYVAEGHVLFAVESYADYGRLSGRTVEDMIAGARVEVAPYKRNPMDFVLWKPSSDDLPGWNSPWGRGRPGWHIECSAMAYELLGESFDIHGGGNDLMFPHHENEIAQSCCAHPEGEFARVWLHNEMLQVEGKKMSKSLGNFFTVRDLLDQGVPGEVIRFVFLSTHYRKPMDWTAEKAREARRALQDMHRVVLGRLPDVVPQPENLDSHFTDALANDLNTHEYIRHLHRFVSLAEDEDVEDRSAAAQALADALAFMGLFNLELVEGQVPDFDSENLALFADRLSALRKSAMQSKEFGVVDCFKSALVDAGVEVRMSKDGVELVPGPDFDPAKLEALK